MTAEGSWKSGTYPSVKPVVGVTFVCWWRGGHSSDERKVEPPLFVRQSASRLHTGKRLSLS